MTEKTKNRIIVLYKSGYSMTKVASIIGCRQPAVSQIITEAGLRRGSRYDLIPKEKRAAICAYYKRGMRVADVAEEFNISMDVTYRVLRSGGHRLSLKHFTPEQVEQIVQMYIDGRTGTEIAETLGVCAPIVYRELQRAGVIRSNWTGPKQLRLQYLRPNGTLERFRSTSEAAFAYYLDSLALKWAYESHTWLLSDGSSYTPDFWVPLLDAYYEVKGYWQPKSKAKVERFQREYPNVNLDIVDNGEFDRLGIDKAAWKHNLLANTDNKLIN